MWPFLPGPWSASTVILPSMATVRHRTGLNPTPFPFGTQTRAILAISLQKTWPVGGGYRSSRRARLLNVLKNIIFGMRGTVINPTSHCRSEQHGRLRALHMLRCSLKARIWSITLMGEALRPGHSQCRRMGQQGATSNPFTNHQLISSPSTASQATSNTGTTIGGATINTTISGPTMTSKTIRTTLIPSRTEWSYPLSNPTITTENPSRVTTRLVRHHRSCNRLCPLSCYPGRPAARAQCPP